jgi:hypothetical protein
LVLLTGHGDGQISKFLGQLLEVFMARQSLLQSWHFIGRDIAGVVPAPIPALKLVEGRSAWSRRLGAKLASLHASDGIHFLKNLFTTLLGCHGEYLYY